VPVFGLLKRAGKVYAVMIADTRSTMLASILRQSVRPDSLIYTDAYRSYDVLDVSKLRHHRVNHKKTFVAGGRHVNGIENFWNQAKRHLRRFKGIPRANFHLYLKECEWRFNYRPTSRLLATLRGWAGI
jgi:transposase